MFKLFDPQVAVENIGPLLAGLLITVELTAVVIVLALICGLLVALAGMSRFVLLRWIIKSYIEVIRGTPLLLQLIYIYYVLPSIGIRLDAFTAGVLALTLNYSAYISEVYRGGIQAIARGQHDAAAALGMTHGLAMRRIILPQAMRIVVPDSRQLLHQPVQGHRACSAVSIQELVFTAQMRAALSFQYFTLYTVVAVMYFAVSFPAARLVGYLERITRAGYRRKRVRP